MTKRILTAVLLLAAIAAAPATKNANEKPKWQLKPEAPAAIIEAAKRADADRPEELKRLAGLLKERSAHLADVRRGTIRKGEEAVHKRGGKTAYIFGSAAAKKEALAKAQRQVNETKRQIEDAKTLPIILRPPQEGEIKVGFVGLLGPARVKEILDGTNVIVTVVVRTTAVPLEVVGNPANLRGITAVREDRQPIWLSGLPTGKMVEGETLETDPPIMVSATIDHTMRESQQPPEPIMKADVIDLKKYVDKK